MKLTYTPSPWGAHKCYVLDDHGNKVAVACPAENIGQGDPFANARLIAAAPELLAALEAIVLRFHDFVIAAKVSASEFESADVVIQARAAIAKAEGK